MLDLKSIGLTQLEIAILSRIIADGYSVRAVARERGVTSRAVQQAKESGLKKLRASGISPPMPDKPRVTDRRPKIRYMDPKEIESLPDPQARTPLEILADKD